MLQPQLPGSNPDFNIDAEVLQVDTLVPYVYNLPRLWTSNILQKL